MGLNTGVGLFERDAEMTALGTALMRPQYGGSVVVLIEGEPGIGKTSLLNHAARQAGELGVRLLIARSTPLDREVPWNVVRQLFLPVLEACGSTTSLLDGAARLALPALGLGGEGANAVDPFSPLHGLYWLTANLAEEQPLCVAIDDLQWADRHSLRFLNHLVARGQDLDYVMVATVRDGREDDPDHAVRSLKSFASAHILRPAPLTREAVAELLRNELPEGVAADLVDSCYELTAGNPFLLTELVREIARADQSAGFELVRELPPRTVARSVLARLARHSPAVNEFARAVAVLGGSGSLSLAAALAGLDAPDQATEAAEILIAESLLVARADRLAYVHPLVREVVYQDLSAVGRWRLHGAAARLLAARGGELRHAAAHLLQTAPAGDAWVVETLRAAAEGARAGGAPEIAAAYLERALEEPPPSALRSEVLVTLGSVQTEFAPATAAERLASAAEAASGPAERVAVAPRRARALALAGRVADAADVMQDAAREARGLPIEVRRQIDAVRFAVLRWDQRSQDACDELFAELRARARAGEHLEPAEHINLANELAARGEDREVAVRHARAGLASPRLPVLAQSVPVVAIVLADRYEEAGQIVDSALRDAQRRGSLMETITASWVAAAVALHNDVPRAIALAEDALRLGDGGVWDTLPLVFLTEGLVQHGEAERAWQELADRGLHAELPDDWPYAMLRLRRGRLHSALGNHADAVEDLLAVGETAERWNAPNPAQIPWRSSAARSLLALGRGEDGRRLAHEELALAERWGAPRAIGQARSVLGMCTPGPEGVGLIELAVTELESTVARLELARALCDLGTRLRREREVARARSVLSRSVDLAHRCGGFAIVRRAHDELLATGARPRRPAQSGRAALTPRELRVAELAAGGLTNREIAQALFISSRTVEHHLSGAFRKLGIEARERLGAAMKGALPPADVPDEI